MEMCTKVTGKETSVMAEVFSHGLTVIDMKVRQGIIDCLK